MVPDSLYVKAIRPTGRTRCRFRRFRIRREIEMTVERAFMRPRRDGREPETVSVEHLWVEREDRWVP